MYTHVVKFGEGRFPAWEQEGGTLLVDLRQFAPDGKTLIYAPEKLRSRWAQVPEPVIAEAAQSNPQGFVRVPKEG